MTEDRSIKLLIADDHALVREGLVAVLSRKTDLAIVGEASSGRQCLELVDTTRPDIVLMDINMPDMSGIEVTEVLTSRHPEVRVLALTVHDGSEYLARMLAAGCAGYVLKGATSDELAVAIRSVFVGGMYLSAGLAGYLEKNWHPEASAPERRTGALTAREDEILDLIGRGQGTQEIAKILNLTVSTVQSHRANMMRKLGIATYQQLLLYALRDHQG